jgi:hypothetical protein
MEIEFDPWKSKRNQKNMDYRSQMRSELIGIR